MTPKISLRNVTKEFTVRQGKSSGKSAPEPGRPVRPDRPG